jgi:hypothetical protein
MQKELARQAAREKGLAKYICISCGHYTDLETQQVYGFARPKRGYVWCEKCDDWLRVMPKRKPKPLPETPLFLWLRQSNGPDAPHNALQLKT